MTRHFAWFSAWRRRSGEIGASQGGDAARVVSLVDEAS